MSSVNNIAAVLYDTHAAADQSVKEPQKSGFSAVKTDKFLALAHGTAEEAATARDIVTGAQPAEIRGHSFQNAAVDNQGPAVATV